MAPHKTITINGRLYDAVTGLPIDDAPAKTPAPSPAKKKVPTAAAAKPVAKPAVKPAPKPVTATSRGLSNSEITHSTVQRSQTLNRRATKKPAVPNKPIVKRNAPGRHMDIARNANVSKFAKHPETKPVAAPASAAPKPATRPAAAKADKPAQVHPVAQRALHRSAAKKKVVTPATKPATAKQVKDAEISKALAAPTPKPKKDEGRNKKALRRAIIIASIVLIVALGLYIAYRFVPAISVGIAASQAGISATYPEYTPDGYSLSHPVTYSDGEVGLKFASNSNDNYYTVTQTRSSWDSSAVLDNVVTPVAGADYTTTKERGLTIYTYGTNAAWVNGGILYKIESKAPLSGDQIRRIATSL